MNSAQKRHLRPDSYIPHCLTNSNTRCRYNYILLPYSTHTHTHTHVKMLLSSSILSTPFSLARSLSCSSSLSDLIIFIFALQKKKKKRQVRGFDNNSRRVFSVQRTKDQIADSQVCRFNPLKSVPGAELRLREESIPQELRKTFQEECGAPPYSVSILHET